MKRMTIAVFLSALFAAGSAAQQKQEQSGEMSLGDYARKLREKQSKDGKDHSWVSGALRNNSNALSTGAYVPPIPQAGKPFDYKAEAKKTDDLADYLEGRTRRQLADDIVRDIQFPGRPNWESRLDSKRQQLVAALRSAAAAYRKAESTPGIGTAAMQEATWKLSLENVGWRELVEEGVRAADKWERSR